MMDASLLLLTIAWLLSLAVAIRYVYKTKSLERVVQEHKLLDNAIFPDRIELYLGPWYPLNSTTFSGRFIHKGEEIGRCEVLRVENIEDKVSLCGSVTGKYLYLADFWLDKPYRHQGIGRRMYARIENAVKENTSIECIVVDPQPESIRFWEKMGFKPIEQMGEPAHMIIHRHPHLVRLLYKRIRS